MTRSSGLIALSLQLVFGRWHRGLEVLGFFLLDGGGQPLDIPSSMYLLQTCRPARLGTQTPATCRRKMAPRMGGFLISVTLALSFWVAWFHGPVSFV